MLPTLSTQFKIKSIFLLFSIFILISYITIDKYYFSQKSKNIALSNAHNKLIEREKVLQQFLSKGTATLESIRNSVPFNNFLENNTNKKEVLNIFEIVAKSNSDFMQLRYIDKDGYEIFRVDRKVENSETFIIPENKLQNKENRYYFADSKSKELEKVWFSDLDLNIENGKVEVPYRPTLRAMLPIKTNNKFNGILIVNYFMEDFLVKFTDMPLYDTVFLNSDGYSLTHFEKNKSWGFYKEKKINLLNEFGDNLNQILLNKSYKDEEFVSRKFETPINTSLYMILKLKHKYLSDIIYKQNIQYITVFLIVLILAFISIYFVSRIIEQLLQDLNKSEQLNNKLQELNSQLNTIMDTTKDGIVIIDLNTNFLFHNKAYIEMLGYTNEDFINTQCLEYIKKSNIKKIENAIKQVQKVGYVNNLEKICIKKDFTEIVTLNSMVLMPDKKRILIIAKDITELKEQEKKLKSQGEILLQQSKMAAMGEILENIAHQWRQPLSMITTSATGLKVQKEYNLLTDEKLEEGIKNIVKFSQFLSDTIDDFRGLLTKDKKKTNFKVNTILDKSLLLVSSKFNNRNIKVVINDDDVEVHSLKNDLVQVFLNILNNARDELEKLPKEKQRLIIIDILKENEQAIITFTDNAGGIPLTIIDKVFDQYFTTKSDKDGTGIGLYMTYNIVNEHMSGQITVNNNEFQYEGITYKGACFKIVLPLAREK